MDEWRKSARLLVETIREFIGLRLILAGLRVLPQGDLRVGIATAALDAMANEFERRAFVDTLAKGIAELPIKIHRRGE